MLSAYNRVLYSLFSVTFKREVIYILCVISFICKTLAPLTTIFYVCTYIHTVETSSHVPHVQSLRGKKISSEENIVK